MEISAPATTFTAAPASTDTSAPAVILTSMVASAEIISPAGILKTKVITEIKFEVRKSLVDNSQKIFEIYFLDKDNRNVVIFKDDSVSNPNNFFIESKDASFYLKQIELENSVFEDIGKFDYPVDNFIVTYKIPSELVKYLADTLNYTIQIKMTDLTSERRN